MKIQRADHFAFGKVISFVYAYLNGHSSFNALAGLATAAL